MSSTAMSEPGTRPVTGIAGYTLIGNSHELVLAAHEAFVSADEMICQGEDVTPHTERIETFPQRILIALFYRYRPGLCAASLRIWLIDGHHAIMVQCRVEPYGGRPARF
ncbi:MAG: fructose-bisphosphatase class III [Kouleothrix sp.]